MIRLLLFPFLIGIFGSLRAQAEVDMERWLEALTYPSEQWRADDFGREASAEDRKLLERFKPRIYLGKGQSPPIDFYRDYLPATVVRDRTRGAQVVLRAPTREDLKRIERRRELYLDFEGTPAKCDSPCGDYSTIAYGRVYEEELSSGKPGTSVSVWVLKYTWVFPFSGLPAKLGITRAAGARLLGKPSRWHELDIHGAVHILLGPDEKPWALLLAQHNHFRSYVFGKDLPRPEGGSVSVCFAARSNEPYPCPEDGIAYHPTTGDPSKITWLLLGKKRPVASGWDRVEGVSRGAWELNYRLEFLPSRDPLYVAWLPLGDRGKILFWDSWEKTGPPGIDMNTWPELKRYVDIAKFWYFPDPTQEDARFMKKHLQSFFKVDFAPILKRNGLRFTETLRKTHPLP